MSRRIMSGDSEADCIWGRSDGALHLLIHARNEQAKIEIAFIEDSGKLIRRYTELQEENLRSALAETRDERRVAFEERAAFCQTVAEDALDRRTELKPIDQDSLDRCLEELGEAAQRAKDTVASINGTISVVNRILDGLILLARVAANVMT